MLNIIPAPKSVKINEGSIVFNEDIYFENINVLLPNEAYRIKVNSDGINVFANSEKGLKYARKTIDMLKFDNNMIPFMEIDDAPNYEYRGFMIDVARHFFPISTIKKYIDFMFCLKLNKLHLHLSDDQGYRLESKVFEKLNVIASKRAETRGDGKPISGYYTQSEIKELVIYAKERNIDIIPEIDMPGHFTAIISAYNELSCEEKAIAVATKFGIFKDIACAGKESTYTFIFKLLDEVFSLFPFELIHLGGDEATKLNWLLCPHCKKMCAELGLTNEEQLQSYFMTKIVEYAKTKGKQVINWNDGLLGSNLPNSLIIQYWKESKLCKNIAIKEVKLGKKVILSPFYKYYFDYPYGMTPLKKTYTYDEQIDGIEKTNILGVEGALWSEYVKNEKQLEFMTAPRIIALAEIGWTTFEKRNYSEFKTRMYNLANYFLIYNISLDKISVYDPNKLKSLSSVIRFFFNSLKNSTLPQHYNNLKMIKKIKNDKH